jgi:tRNA-specific 2-thiouridylase
MSCKKVYAVALSGGVDSSVAAAILKMEGHEIFGITMDIHENCVQDVEDARRVCKNLGIEHIVLDVRDKYKEKVIDLFVQYYASGLTPNPCSFCNRDLKLNILVNFVRGKGADLMATGHYAKLRIDGGRVCLSEGANNHKDQSYFVSLAPRGNLKFVRFPLGDVPNKEETRRMAFRFGLSNFKKCDSQDICFIRDGTYKEFLRKLQLDSGPGKIRRHGTGEIIGEHNGIINYTIGQRKGIGVSDKDPLYVVRLDPSSKDVIVGTKKSLEINEFEIIDVNWILDIEDEFVAFIKVRSFSKKSRAKVTKKARGIAEIRLLEASASPVAGGQVCVMYDSRGYVIGAGIISAVCYKA